MTIFFPELIPQAFHFSGRYFPKAVPGEEVDVHGAGDMFGRIALSG